MPATIVDRDGDIWEPLTAVADATGGHWPETARVTAVTLVTLRREKSGSAFVYWTICGPRLAMLSSSQRKPLNDRGLAARLRCYSIKRRVIRIGSTTQKGYRREDFVEAPKQSNRSHKVTSFGVW
jgi:hypothetical protein